MKAGGRVCRRCQTLQHAFLCRGHTNFPNKVQSSMGPVTVCVTCGVTVALCTTVVLPLDFQSATVPLLPVNTAQWDGRYQHGKLMSAAARRATTRASNRPDRLDHDVFVHALVYFKWPQLTCCPNVQCRLLYSKTSYASRCILNRRFALVATNGNR